MHPARHVWLLPRHLLPGRPDLLLQILRGHRHMPFRGCQAGATCEGNCEGSCGCDDADDGEDPPPPAPVKDCCPEGQSCYGNGCIPDKRLPACVAEIGTCGCNATPPPPADCCGKGESCCGDGCVPTEDLPFMLCLADPGSCGCNPTPPPPDDCCPEGQ